MTLQFYENKLPYKEKQFNKIFPLGSYFGEMIGNNRNVHIADIGSGMFSTTGSTWPNTHVYLYPSDILANEYKKILDRKGIVSVIPVEKQDMTRLTYHEGQFDIVHCVNALDHCTNPSKALQEMYRICKSGGWIYLRHFLNNAEYHNYGRSHIWNISTIDDQFYIWNRSCILRDEIPHGFHSVIENDSFAPGRVVISRMRK